MIYHANTLTPCFKTNPPLQGSFCEYAQPMRYDVTLLIRSVNTKWFQQVLQKIQSGNHLIYRRKDRKSYGWTGKRTDKVKPVYPLFVGGGYNYSYNWWVRNQSTHHIQNRHGVMCIHEILDWLKSNCHIQIICKHYDATELNEYGRIRDYHC